MADDGERLNADAIVARLMEINRPNALVVTEVDLDGDILIGMAVRAVRYDGFHNRITITGVMEPPSKRGREILHGKGKG